MRKGTPNQFIAELEDKIAELKGIKSACNIHASETDSVELPESIYWFLQDVAQEVGPFDYTTIPSRVTKDQLRLLKNAKRRWIRNGEYNDDQSSKKAEEIGRQVKEILDTISIQSSSEVIDDGTDVIEAGTDMDSINTEDILDWLSDHETAWEDMLVRFKIKDEKDLSKLAKDDLLDWIWDHDQLTEDFCTYFDIREDVEGSSCVKAGMLGEKLGQLDDLLTPSIPVSVQSGEDVDISEEIIDKGTEDHSEYLDHLYTRVEEELSDMITDVAWTGDEENIFMDVSFQDGHVFTFTIPRSDLVYDMENEDTDVEYICVAVRDSQDATDDIATEELKNEIFLDNGEVEDTSSLYEEYDIPAYL